MGLFMEKHPESTTFRFKNIRIEIEHPSKNAIISTKSNNVVVTEKGNRVVVECDKQAFDDAAHLTTRPGDGHVRVIYGHMNRNIIFTIADAEGGQFGVHTRSAPFDCVGCMLKDPYRELRAGEDTEGEGDEDDEDDEDEDEPAPKIGRFI